MRALRCNPIELSQVLINLINNAFDAVRRQPGAWIGIEAIEEDGQVVVRVRDSGSGIDQKSAARLFNPFFTTEKVGMRTGLGLSISKGLVEAAGGSLEYEPEQPNTCFAMRMPFAEQAGARA